MNVLKCCKKCSSKLFEEFFDLEFFKFPGPLCNLFLLTFLIELFLHSWPYQTQHKLIWWIWLLNQIYLKANITINNNIPHLHNHQNFTKKDSTTNHANHTLDPDLWIWLLNQNLKTNLTIINNNILHLHNYQNFTKDSTTNHTNHTLDPDLVPGLLGLEPEPMFSSFQW